MTDPGTLISGRQPATSEQTSALWGGRFSTAISDVAHRFSSSIFVDGKLYREDIEGSIAHATMLGECGIISRDEAQAIVGGLEAVLSEIESGAFVFDASMEDVHMAIEQRLTSKIGVVGGKLHTGRSRNDQVATDVRLYMRRALGRIDDAAKSLMQELVAMAETYADVVMPGYTHMQRAQPVLLAHHMLAYVEMFARDRERIADAVRRVNRSPLGSAAFAGTPYSLDRDMTSNALGFTSPLANSMDAVSDRDHLIEAVSDCSIVMMHLSRMAEELVLWSTAEFGFITMSDAVTTGSSIMPQKKNPDMAELIRGKVGKVYGALMNLLTIMKALPLAYNRDMQEDKQPLFDALETTESSLRMMTILLQETTFHTPKLQRALDEGYVTATEIADYLATRGVPFREAHHITGRIVAYAVEQGVGLLEIPLAEYRRFSDQIDETLYHHLQPATSITAKQSLGSTNPSMVAQQLKSWKERLGV